MSVPPQPPPASGFSPKVTGATTGAVLAGAVVVIINYVVKMRTGTDLPIEVQAALQILLPGVASFVGGYIRPH